MADCVRLINSDQFMGEKAMIQESLAIGGMRLFGAEFWRLAVKLPLWSAYDISLPHDQLR